MILSNHASQKSTNKSNSTEDKNENQSEGEQSVSQTSHPNNLSPAVGTPYAFNIIRLSL